MRRKRPVPPVDRKFHTPDEFSAATNLSRATVWRLMKAGKVRFTHMGRQRRIPTTEYARLAAEAD
jgi:excisionase family DNA binding protein